MPDQSENKNTKHVQAEVIEPDDSRYRENSRQSGASTSRQVIYRTFYVPGDSAGCLAASITFALFFVCLVQVGLLGAIGFVVFHVIGNILGGYHAARQLMAGLPYNPWTWRVGNWVVSFLLTMWLAGGMK